MSSTHLRSARTYSWKMSGSLTDAAIASRPGLAAVLIKAVVPCATAARATGHAPSTGSTKPTNPPTGARNTGLVSFWPSRVVEMSMCRTSTSTRWRSARLSSAEPVPEQRRLGVGPARQMVPQILRQLAARRQNDLLQAHELLRRRLGARASRWRGTFRFFHRNAFFCFLCHFSILIVSVFQPARPRAAVGSYPANCCRRALLQRTKILLRAPADA